MSGFTHYTQEQWIQILKIIMNWYICVFAFKEEAFIAEHAHWIFENRNLQELFHKKTLCNKGGVYRIKKIAKWMHSSVNLFIFRECIRFFNPSL